VSSIFAVVAMLKAGGYRSPKAYTSRAKDRHVELGFRWDDELARAVRKVVRSATRGLGPSRQSQALPFDELHKLPLDSEPYVSHGPIGPRNLLIVGSLFCTREIEVSLALKRHVTFDTLRSAVSWCLPCDKTDPTAVGKTRTWGCLCRDQEQPPEPTDICPFHALVLQFRYLECMFGDTDSIPLFPTQQGRTAAKEDVVATIESAAIRLGLPVKDHNGRNLYGGHSLRVTGAQKMAAMGLPLLTIQLIARWSSAIIMRYVGEAPLASVTEEYRKANAGADLRAYMAASDQLFSQLRERLREIDERTSRLLDEEREIRRPPPTDCRPMKARRGPAYVMSANGRVHAPRSRYFSDWPVFEWKARCGWLFGLGSHSPLDQIEVGAKVCRICLPRPENTPDASSDSEASEL